jgi:hypothetical protein
VNAIEYLQGAPKLQRQLSSIAAIAVAPINQQARREAWRSNCVIEELGCTSKRVPGAHLKVQREKKSINGTIGGAERSLDGNQPVVLKRTARVNGGKSWQKHYPVLLIASLHLDSSQCLPLVRTLRKPLASAKAKALLPINAAAATQSGASAKAEIQKPRHSERCMSDTRLNR